MTQLEQIESEIKRLQDLYGLGMVTTINWIDWREKKPRAGRWVLVLTKNHRIVIACRPKGSDVVFFVKGKFLVPLAWASRDIDQETNLLVL